MISRHNTDLKKKADPEKPLQSFSALNIKRIKKTVLLADNFINTKSKSYRANPLNLQSFCIPQDLKY